MSAAAIRDERSAEFFDALAAGRLLIRRCVPDGHLSSPDVTFCAECGTPGLEWVEAAGDGKVVSWTAIHGRPDETGATVVNVFVGLVELTEGPWLMARLLVDDEDVDDEDDLHIGARVVLSILATDGEPIYAFGLSGSVGQC
jgi:uncharacterized OB-fold protein